MGERNESGQFVKGYSGGPGRPPKAREEKYHEILVSAITFDDFRRIILKAKDQAIKGDAVARKFIADYLVGTPIQRTEHSGPNGGAIPVQRFEAAIENAYGNGNDSD